MPSYFTTATYAFLRDLAAHNERDWFHANKQRYVDHVQEPALRFIADFAPRLERLSPHFVADAKVVGGSLYRIQRDARFAKGAPYKENSGVHFRHESARDAHAPGFYLHLQPGASFLGVGMWRPPTAVAYRVRERIAEDPNGWHRAAHGTRFLADFALTGDSLVNPPRGFDAAHPYVEDLKRKDFVASVSLTQKAVTATDFLDEFTRRCRVSSPFMRFLCESVGVPF